jgi:hypothetical protein
MQSLRLFSGMKTVLKLQIKKKKKAMGSGRKRTYIDPVDLDLSPEERYDDANACSEGKDPIQDPESTIIG